MKPNPKTLRSGLEDSFRILCEKEGIHLEYETGLLPYVTAPSKKRYTPDWTISKQAYIETKGYWDAAGRRKALYIKEQHPDVRILYVFQRNNKIHKLSNTTYGEYCDKHGLEWCVFSNMETWMKFIKENQSDDVENKNGDKKGTGRRKSVQGKGRATKASTAEPKKATRTKRTSVGL